MRSFRAHGVVALVALGTLVGVAQGQIYAPPTAYQAQPAQAYSTQYNGPPACSYGPSPWTYAQPAMTHRPVQFGFSSLASGAPIQQTNLQPLPQVDSPQNMNVAPSPSDLPAPNAAARQYMPQAAPSYSPHAAYGNPYLMPGAGCATGACDMYGKGCGTCGKTSCCGCDWFGGAYALMMTRDNENDFYFSFDTNDVARQRTTSDHFDLAGGFGIHLGRYFNCGCNAIQGVYWGVYPGTSSTSTTAWDISPTGALWGIHNWNNLDYGGSTADQWVNGLLGVGAAAHAIWRENQFHNVEINLLHIIGGRSQWPCCESPLSINWLVGFRYFNLQDEFMFGADNGDGLFTWNADEIYYNINTKNNLWGCQIGAETEYCVTQRLAFDFGVKVGCFSNQIEHDSYIGGPHGVAVINDGTFTGRDFDVHSTKSELAMLAEFNLGMAYHINCNWKAIAGYRLVGLTGVALPTNQIYPDFRGINDVEAVDSNGSLILHGGYFGAEYNY